MVDRQLSRDSSPESSSDCGFEVVNSSNWCISDDEWNEISASRRHAEYFFIGGADSPRGSDEGSDTKEERTAVPELAKRCGTRGPLRIDVAKHRKVAVRRAKEDTFLHRDFLAAAKADASLVGKVSAASSVQAQFINKDLAEIRAAVAIEAESLSKVLAIAEEANASLLAKLSALSAAEAESLNNVLATAAEADASFLEKINAASALEVEFLNKGLQEPKVLVTKEVLAM
jgi:hypothetical protein